MLNHALNLAKRGWYVFPCREKVGTPFQRDGETIIPQEKRPYTFNGLHDATIDPDKIREFWGKYPNALIGVNCERSGLFVVDIDTKHVDGVANWHKLGIDDSGALHSRTPSGGMHIVWKGVGKTGANGKTGIDTRGVGGYFIAPPSEILVGEYAGKYIPLDDWDKEPDFMPEGVLDKIYPPAYTSETQSSSQKKQLSRSTMEFIISGAIHGERNISLFKALADMAGCGYTKEEAREKCYPSSKQSGLPDSEFEDTLRKAYSKPRTPSIPESIQDKILNRASPEYIASTMSDEENLIIEEAILSVMIKDNSVILKVSDVITEKEFQNSRYGRIFKTIVQLKKDGIAVDSLTLYDELSKIDEIELNYVVTLEDKYPIISEHATSYAHVIKIRSALREYRDLLVTSLEECKGGVNLSSLMSKFSNRSAHIAIKAGNTAEAPLTSAQAIEHVKEKMQDIRAGKIVQRQTGFVHYDKNGGFYIPELIMVTGRPGDGKSALLLSLANNIGIGSKSPVAFFTLEMSTYEVMCRLVCQLTGIAYGKIYSTKNLTIEEATRIEEAMDLIKTSPIYFNDPSGITVNQLKVKMRQLKEERGVDVFMVDQLEQIVIEGKEAVHIEMNKITYQLKNISKELDSTIFLAHQLNRAVTDRKIKDAEPQLSDVSQAGEKAVNQAWAIVHKWYESKIIESKVKVMKNRNGAREDFAVQWVGEKMLFSNPIAKTNFVNEKDYLDNDDSDTPAWAQGV